MPLIAYEADFHVLRLVMRPFIRVIMPQNALECRFDTSNPDPISVPQNHK